MGAPLGPGSLTWKFFGDVRSALLTQRSGVLQVMHPAITAAVFDHSYLFENPTQRLLRSAGPILGVIYDEDGEGTAHWVRDRHTQIRGHDSRGRRYHALDPETYYWAHATFFESQIATQEIFGKPFSTEQKEQLYAESVTWYERYGLTMRPVPRDYAAFERWWQSMFDDVLEATPIALSAVRPARDLPAPYPVIDGPLWTLMRPLFARGGPWLARGTLPPQAREMLEVEWSAADELALNGLRTALKTAWPIAAPGLTRVAPELARRSARRCPTAQPAGRERCPATPAMRR
jgi:uncharacterized protein (DUF2236 family)